MSAEILRRAAELMRERAEAATPGPWYANPGGYVELNPFGEGEHYNMVADTANQRDGNDAAHIASWQPAVAQAVADWLDEQADTYLASRFRAHDDQLDAAALAVALAYLSGEPA